MSNSKVVTLISALPGYPERTVKYVSSIATPEASIGYDSPLVNYIDTSKYSLPSERTSSRLYDTIAFAHDHRRPNRELSFSSAFARNWRERSFSVPRLSGRSIDHLELLPDLPARRSRRSSYELRRGAIPVAPSDVSTLLPPMDTSSPPPSNEWLDEKAKQILAAAHAEFDTRDYLYPSKSPNDGTEIVSSVNSNNQIYLDLHFDYDVDSNFGPRTTTARTAYQQSIPQPHSAKSASSESDSLNTDTEIDTDVDEESDGGYNWSTTRICEATPHALADIPRWIIPRKRPSVVISDNGDVPMDNDDDDDDSDDDDDDLSISGSSGSSRSSTPTECGTPPLSSDDEHIGKRHRGGTLTPSRAVKKLKRHSADTPARQGRRSLDSADSYYTTDSEDDMTFSERASSLPPCPSIASVRSCPSSASPPRVSTPPIQPGSPRVSPHHITATQMSSRAKPAPKSYPCLLDGCNQVCASAGDLQRHQQSLRHRAPSCTCLACGKTYTRPDALKRHLNAKAACKREHASKLAQQIEEEGQVEAEAEEA